MPLYRKSIINERMYPMENQFLKEKSTYVIQQVQDDLYANKQCIAAYLLGSYSHDKVWEWSDIEIAVILDDDYKGKPYYDLYAEDRWLSLNVYTLTNFKEFISTVATDNFLWKAFSKCTKLFSKDLMLDELMEDAFYIGDIDREQEMLLGFSGAVYYLNKSEKNLYIKENLENTLYFIPQIAENIAWIEIFKNKKIPERELIPQGKKLNPDIFAKIYDPLFKEQVDENVLKDILKNCVSYLEEHTSLIYRPIISYLEKHGNLEHFKYETRPHGFGINYEWLVRYGIAERYGIPEKVPFLKQAEKLNYRLK